ncbi:MAG: cupin domain-containing protein [Saprospiraceae bacterium]|nr:cupin domain-containing protein [Saprospiraceae bacterium]
MRTLVIVMTTAALCLSAANTLTAQDELRHFALDSLIDVVEQSERPWLGFFSNENLTTGIYTLEAGATDKQSPHKSDEIYYVVEGDADFRCAGKTVSIKPGSILFVEAEASHQFLNIRKKLVLLVFFD